MQTFYLLTHLPLNHGHADHLLPFSLTKPPCFPGYLRPYKGKISPLFKWRVFLPGVTFSRSEVEGLVFWFSSRIGLGFPTKIPFPFMVELRFPSLLTIRVSSFGAVSVDFLGGWPHALFRAEGLFLRARSLPPL